MGWAHGDAVTVDGGTFVGVAGLPQLDSYLENAAGAFQVVRSDSQTSQFSQGSFCAGFELVKKILA